MPIQTDISVAPYFDDFTESKNYHQVLFKPGVALQTRELNTLQTMLQNQIERFGDNIFSKGTIISGCNFQYYTNYPYVKLVDSQNDGQPAVVNNYIGLYASSATSNLVAYILGANTGYISQAPDLNTLYLRYINSGTTGTQTAYVADDVLTLYDSNNSIFQVTVPVGGTGGGFSNTDSVVFMAAISFSNTTASIATIAGNIGVGNTISDAVSGARAVITEVNITAVANTLILKVKPYQADMLNAALTNANNWTFNAGNTVLIQNGVSTTVQGTVGSLYGAGATATPITDGTGKVVDVLMVSQGTGYSIAPYATIKTANSSAAITNLIASPLGSLTALNYKCKITVANATASGASGPSGVGYAFGVSEGIIYQKGYFLYVNPQTTVVTKYSNVPDNLTVGFDTSESIINSNIDTTLLDNATGTYNSQAPGADRLKLSPYLTVLSTDTAAGNNTFFSITAFSAGMPYLQNQQTSYNVIGDALAQRTYESAGNFVTDPFLLSTKTANLNSSISSSDQANTFNVTIDPGEGYISGYRVKTYTNYTLPIKQGIDTVNNDVTVNLNYGNYFLINEIGGVFNFTTGDYVTLYDTAKTFLTNTQNITTGNTLPTGNVIGTARIRSAVPYFGTPGTPSAQNRLYVYDINMYPGKNLYGAKSVYYSNTYSGIADIVLTNVASLNANVALVANAATSTAIFPHGANSTANSSNLNFTYNGLFSNGTSNTTFAPSTGQITVQLGSHIFPYGNGATLTDSQLAQISVQFHEANNQASTNTAGVSFTTSASTNVMTISAGATTTFSAGDYLKVFSTTGSTEIKRVSTVTSTTLQVDSAFTLANTIGANVVQFFPRYIRIPLNGRLLGDRSANINSTGSLLTIVLGKVFASSANVTVTTPVIAKSLSQTGKTSNRDTTVAINIANNRAGTTGPWPLGHPDIFRLKKVYKDVNTAIISGSTAVAANIADPTTIPSTWTDVTNEFYIDHRQNKDFYDHGILSLKPKSRLVVGSGDALVVSFDHFTPSGGAPIFTKSSYPVDDTKTYNVVSISSSTNIHTHEIPEMVDDQGNYYDLIDHVDFRPRVANTANVTAANTNLSTINPVDLGAVLTASTNGTLTTSCTWIT